MIEIRNCPSSLRDGFDTYSPKAAKSLFGTTKVNPTLGFDIDEFRNVGEIAEAMRRISVSGVQEKFPAIINAGKINIAGDQERSTHILKPAPWDKTLIERNKYTCFPENAKQLVDHSFLSDKMKRNYVRIVNERISRYNRASEM